MELRPYQADLVERVVASLNGGVRAVVMQMPTGGGKTATASSILERATRAGGRSLFLAHLDTLIEDTHERLSKVGVRAGFVQAGRAADPLARVQVGSIATLHARGERPPANLVVLDECHRALGPSVRAILDAYPLAWILGLTATPQRGDGRALGAKAGGVFEEMHLGPTMAELQALGFLVPIDVIAPERYLEKTRAADPVEAYLRHTPGTRAICFVESVAEAGEVAERFRASGVTAAVVTGETKRLERRVAIAGLASGEIKVLVGVSVFVEGFDCPPIETVILARGFEVTGAYLQAIGRGSRPSPGTGKTRCTVLDLRGVVHIHGLPDEARRWSLTGKPADRMNPRLALRRCTECLAIFRAAVECPRCGARAEKAERVARKVSRSEKLAEVSKYPIWIRDDIAMNQLRFVARVRVRIPEEHVERWATNKFRKRFGREPVKKEESRT